MGILKPTLRTSIYYILNTLPWVCLAILISYYWIDRPLASYCWQFLLKRHGILKHLSGGLAITLTETAYIGLLGTMTLCFYLHLYGFKGRFRDCLSLISLTCAFTFFTKDTLQFVFGRYVPRYADGTYLLFLHNTKLYGFAWYQIGSFPSGHMAMLSCGLTALLLYYRHFWLYFLAFLLTLILATLLILLSYHFLSDLIAGLYLGVTITLALYYLLNQYRNHSCNKLSWLVSN